MKRAKILLVGLILAISLVFFTSALAEAGENSIFINGQEFVTQPTPFIENGRVLVPFRAIFEAVDAEVNWDEDLRKITAAKAQINLEMTLGSNTAYINGQPIVLDVAPQISEGRSFVPLRFVGETLGYAVSYDHVNKWVFINEPGVIFGLQDAIKYLALKDSIYGIKVGDSVAHTVELLGQPTRKDAIDLGFSWWVYNQDYANYLQVGIKDNKVVTLFSIAAGMQFNGLKIGSTFAEIKKQYSFDDDIVFYLQGANFRVNPISDNRYLVIQGETAYVFYLDIHQDSTLTAIRSMDLETLILSRLFSFI